MESVPKKINPPQSQSRQPGLESVMRPPPEFLPRFKGADRLAGKVAMITGGDSGIGRAVAVAMAREGASIAVIYLNEHGDAKKTLQYIEAEGGKAILLAGDIGKESFCKKAVQKTLKEFGKIDILVNNAAEQHEVEKALEIGTGQLARTFQTNVFAIFYLTKMVIPHLKRGAAIVNTASVTAYKGHETLIDYACHQGRHRRLHPLPVAGAGGKGDKGQRGGSRPHLDAADSSLLQGKEGRGIWLECAHETPRPAQ